MSDSRGADTAKVVAELRAELDRLASVTAGSSAAAPKLGPSLQRMHEATGITGDHPVSVRPGPLGPVKRAIKSGTRKATRWYVERLAVDVRTFAHAATATADALAARASALETRLAAELEAAAVVRADVERQLAALADRLGRIERTAARPAPAPPRPSVDSAPVAQRPDDAGVQVHGFDYFTFEATMRGSREEIARRQQKYLPLFEAVDDILDIGCGRGEFLELLRAAGKRGRGVDLDADMVDQCRAAGLDVECRDAVEALDGLEPGSLGGIFAAQVVEHLPPRVLVAFLEGSRRALAPGGVIVLETINPTSLSALRNYFSDLTHSQPLVPETLKFLVESAGFTGARIELTSALPDAARLVHVPFGDSIPEEALVASHRNIEILNGILFAPQDYAVIAGA